MKLRCFFCSILFFLLQRSQEFSDRRLRLLLPKRRTNRLRNSFVHRAITLYTSSLGGGGGEEEEDIDC